MPDGILNGMKVLFEGPAEDGAIKGVGGGTRFCFSDNSMDLSCCFDPGKGREAILEKDQALEIQQPSISPKQCIQTPIWTTGRRVQFGATTRFEVT